MAEPFQQLFDQAMQLSPGEREELAIRLLHTAEVADAPKERDEAWRDEIASRLDDVDNSRVELISAEEIHRQIRARVRPDS